MSNKSYQAVIRTLCGKFHHVEDEEEQCHHPCVYNNSNNLCNSIFKRFILERYVPRETNAHLVYVLLPPPPPPLCHVSPLSTQYLQRGLEGGTVLFWAWPCRSGIKREKKNWLHVKSQPCRVTEELVMRNTHTHTHTHTHTPFSLILRGLR